MMRRQTDKIDPIRSRFGKIEKEEVSLPEKLADVELYAREHRTFSFRELLAKQPSRVRLVVTFLAVLELMKTGKITIRQEQPFERYLYYIHDLRGPGGPWQTGKRKRGSVNGDQQIRRDHRGHTLHHGRFCGAFPGSPPLQGMTRRRPAG